jgi:hypothetical protein
MSVYVGIDVHRKRSQVAVAGQSGEGAYQPECPQRGGADPAGDRRPAAGDPGRVRGRVRDELAGGLRVLPAPGALAAVQGDRLGPAEERQGPAPRPWPSCSGRTCCPKPGSPRRRCASQQQVGAVAQAGLLWVRRRRERASPACRPERGYPVFAAELPAFRARAVAECRRPAAISPAEAAKLNPIASAVARDHDPGR